MSRQARPMTSSPIAELKCSRCYKLDSCIQCCGVRFCLRHFHTSNHASDHPRKAFVMNQAALDKQLPAFEEMWREAFQSVADDIDRLSQEVGQKVADDPLATIGMARPEKPRVSPSKSGKGAEDSSNGASGATKRQRTAEKDKEEAAAKAAVMADPFARRRTRPKSYWANATEGGALVEGMNSMAPPETRTVPMAPMGEYQCELCESQDTSFDVIGGAAAGSRKAETFGRKDAPELILRVVCHACGYTWMEER